MNHTDADNDYESGFYYFKAHADEFETLTEEELSSIFHADSGIILLIGQLAEPLVPETFMNMTQMVIQNSLEALEQMTAIAQEKK